MTTPRSSLQILAGKLPIFHPQPNSGSKSHIQLRNSISSPHASRDWSVENFRRTSIGLPTPNTSNESKYTYGFLGRGRGRGRGHRRQLSLSSFSVRGVLWGAILGFLVIGLGIGWLGRRGLFSFNGLGALRSGEFVDDGGIIPLGRSRERGGREVFWWEQFKELTGYYGGLQDIVSKDQWLSEQNRNANPGKSRVGGRDEVTRQVHNRKLIDVTPGKEFVPCHIDEEKGILPPKISAYNGLPQGFPAPLFGSHDEIGLRSDVCYDRINRFGPYGYGFTEEEGGLGIKMEGDSSDRDTIKSIDYRNVKWEQAQNKCVASKKYAGPRTAFIIRTWHNFEYTPFHIMMLRAIVSELALTTGGRYTIRFLIHVQDDSIPIWASEEVYNEVLAASLPTEFAGMGTLWSVAQMKFIYPPPFPESPVNFSGDEIYKAYRSLHFPLQYFAQKHPEFEYFWHWEMDIRVTGGYLELLEQVTTWAKSQEREYLWEKSSTFFIPALHQNSYTTYETTIKSDLASTKTNPISGPQLPDPSLLSLLGITNHPSSNSSHVDLITFSPLFDPTSTKWAFHDDITGYETPPRPPTRAALITATRLSRRLLLTMHHETFQHKHTMFPEMFPASVALHYGFKAVYAPLPVYTDRDWPARHADQVFNNAGLDDEAKAAGMDHGGGFFHGVGGSVFGPGEHVFRGATWYSNAQFAGYLWRRWFARESYRGDEIEVETKRGRMCLPMMVLHPVKFE